MSNSASDATFTALDPNPCLSTYDATFAIDPNPQMLQAHKEGHLYFPIDQVDLFENSDGGGDTDRLLAARNLFAFLLHKPLVASRRFPDPFSVFFSIATYLKELGFYDDVVGDFGVAPLTAFSFYCEQFSLLDMRGSSEKILEGIILGERMRSTELYNEAFTHFVGAYSFANMANSRLFNIISQNTRNRLEREYMDLELRHINLGRPLSDFEFPHIFNGSASSKVTAESKVVRFASWRSHFASFRTFVLNYYKEMHGSWPPRVNSKKNNFTLPGLNRIVLQILYEDFSSLYDLLVDRDALTTRSLDVEEVTIEDDMTEKELEIMALRKIMSEHDISNLPVAPPIPFDLPQLPDMQTIDAAFGSRSEKEQQLGESRKLKFFETTLIMAKAHSMDQGIQQPFLSAFAAFEQKESDGKSLKELRDQRYGYWLLLYAVLQSLPMLVVEPANLRHTEGVEYFLCKPPLGPPPWLESSHGVTPHADELADNTPEGIYSRSHCWLVGARLLHELELRNPHSNNAPSHRISAYRAPVDDDWPDLRHSSHSDAAHSEDAASASSAAGHLRQGSATLAPARPEHPRSRSASRQRRGGSRNSGCLAAEYFGGGGLASAPGSRPSSGYFGASHPASRPGSRGPGVEEGRSVSDGVLASGGARGSVGVSVSVSASQTATARVEARTFDDILEGIEREREEGRGKGEEKGRERGRKDRVRRSFFGGS